MGNILNSFNDDTICAIATAMSDAGIGIIRVSGKDALSICSKIYISGKREKDLLSHTPNSIKYGFICDGDRIVDEVMISYMKAPHSYTCEDVIEINSHGGMLVMNEILSLLLQSGCRLAEPGEFTKRAFLNGRIDLTKAEAVMDIIEAQNRFALESSRAQLSGNIYNEVTSLRKDIIYQMAYIESALDDPENYDLTGYSDQLKDKLLPMINKISSLLKSADEGMIRKDGIKTVIIGKPNAGKSSLLNALSGSERAIVTDIAGTTRDVIEETVRLDDIVLNLIDTAGIRETEDLIEKIGVDRAKEKIEEADLCLYVLDSTSDVEDIDKDIFKLCEGKKTIVILNKNDLTPEIKISKDILPMLFSGSDTIDFPVITTSLLNREGLDDLKAAITDLFFNGDLAPKQEIYITNLRHKKLLEEAAGSLQLVVESIDKDLSEDFYTIDLSNAYSSLGEIIGEEVGDDLVEEIFSKFCMGK
ncbi:tRNA uridine-5-carboxymethylaminomethyl(34) synthesis GTPase MnmE [Butyrivibrio sp. CB08]|uniref:tRNA uridine-5-carboxymethylaminomethyl(34) synthesis GTPase MnmE n=1 Tax=Butyrivibrio sp. CB08 TaxID=2364879 RepID=UPI000EA949EE|nr:tRNA uridine-5-carboxymethylaminomethyl(34) synthesis GTPase MnmE [Butyrivibrio sp. CB08]RKM58852.1 tRNA uridine-5-carboxymethylaminomethyl(34) synthesis GTPase MnmE [Butyrivibrio sp. CB08]